MATANTIKINGNEHYVTGDTTGLTLPDLDRRDWYDGNTDCWSDDGCYSVYAWDLGGGKTLYVDTDQGEPVNVIISEESIQAHLYDWDFGSMGYPRFSEFLAAFGLYGLAEEQVADPDWDGECLVWRAPNYYHGTSNAPKARFDRHDRAYYRSMGEDYPYEAYEEIPSETGEEGIIVFPSYSAAAAYVSNYYNAPSGYDGIPACNVLSHGQAGADTLTIVKR